MLRGRETTGATMNRKISSPSGYTSHVLEQTQAQTGQRVLPEIGERWRLDLGRRWRCWRTHLGGVVGNRALFRLLRPSLLLLSRQLPKVATQRLGCISTRCGRRRRPAVIVALAQQSLQQSGCALSIHKWNKGCYNAFHVCIISTLTLPRCQQMVHWTTSACQTLRCCE